jgi:hypothetical protein
MCGPEWQQRVNPTSFTHIPNVPTPPFEMTAKYFKPTRT